MRQLNKIKCFFFLLHLLKPLPKIPFCTNIRTDSEMNIKPHFLYRLDESYQIVSSFEIVLQTKQKQKKPTNFSNLTL